MFYCRSISLKHNTLSSCESELGGAAEATQDIIWMRNLFDQLGFNQDGPTTLYTDNASLVTLATEYSGNHKRVRHFVTRLNWMISKVEDGIVQLIHMPGIDMPADTLTKPQPATLFLKNRDRIFNSKTASVAPPDALSSFTASTVCLAPIPLLRPSLSTPASKLLRRVAHDLILQQRQKNAIFHTQIVQTKNTKLIKFPNNMFTNMVFFINDPPNILLL